MSVLAGDALIAVLLSEPQPHHAAWLHEFRCAAGHYLLDFVASLEGAT